MPGLKVPNPSAPEMRLRRSRKSTNHVSALAQPEVNADAAEDAEILQASIRAGSVAQIVVAVIAVIGLIYLLKLVLVTALASLLLAFVLEPLVGGLVRIHVPRAVGALLAVVLMVGLAAGSHVLLLRTCSGLCDTVAEVLGQNTFQSCCPARADQADRREHAFSDRFTAHG